ncbi:hypothetical protein AZE42_02656 [Rhizopogon vesiculosus]|uniref:F-box domain-containing protein n=1 Tax=Rhizopogon vesiculosus TaxID=180088 RepID=A0A1J8QWC4_9AGAM|nr:hypothetical protein AZE42_02656 [Rhizopogon vesiculosus]
MHKCLYVSEIVRNICSKVRRLGEVDDSTIALEAELFEARRTLYHFALTCRSMKEPALDILWGDLDSLYPLLCCLPGLHTRTDDNLQIGRALRASDLDIFRQYAKRVRYLGYSHNKLYMHKDMVRVLCSFPPSPNGSLLPNLRFLSWESDDSEVFPFIRYFLPPSLLSLQLPGELWYAPKVSFTTFLRTYCPNLRQLVCASPNRAAAVRISEYICESNELEFVNCGLPSAAAVKRLMKLPSLKQLFITLTEDGSYEGYKGQFRPQLTSFAINAGGLNQVELFIHDLQLSPTHLQFGSLTLVEYQDVESFFTQLPKSFSPAKLERLRVTVEDVQRNPEITSSLYDLGVQALKGLFQFKNLTEVSLEHFRMSDLDDSAMSTFVASWPNMEVLKLGTGFDWRTSDITEPIQRSRITFKGLTTLVSGCRKLRVLGLVFDARIVDPDGFDFKFHTRNQMNENVVEFDVGASLISIPVPVAVFISSLMPKARKLACVTHCYRGGIMQKITDSRPRLWSLVGEMLRSLSVVRKQGRLEGNARWDVSSDEECD